MVCSARKLREQPRPQAAGPLPHLHSKACCQVSPGPRRLKYMGTVRNHPAPPRTPHTQTDPSRQSSAAGCCSPPREAPFCYYVGCTTGFPSGSVGKESACNAGATGDVASIPGSGRSPGGGHGNPLQYSCLENPQGQRSLVGYSPWGCKESDTTERLSTQAGCTAVSSFLQKRAKTLPLCGLCSKFHHLLLDLLSFIPLKVSASHCLSSY